MWGRVSCTQAEIMSGSSLPDEGWINSSIFSALFKGICRVVANRLIGQQFIELWHHDNCVYKENATVTLQQTSILDIRT